MRSYSHLENYKTFAALKTTSLSILALFAILFLFSNCKKDKIFTDPSAKLEFSEDTILFDTVFTTIGSTTAWFKIYNRHDQILKVSSIDLEGGTQSPFRINVDGVSGLSFEDIEIPANDSLFIFVDVTLDASGTNNPLIIEDHLIFFTNGNEQIVDLVVWGQDAHFYHADTYIQGFPPFSIIDCNDEWFNDKPYVIYGYAVVDSACSLTIHSGVNVYFHANSGLWVYRGGHLTVLGELDDRVYFQGDRLEPFYDDIPGQWDRIWINEGPNDNVFNWAVIRNSLVGIQAETFPLDPNAPTTTNKLILNNTIIENASALGLLTRNYKIDANNLLVANCGQYCVALSGGGEYNFHHTTIANYWSYGTRQTPAFVMTNSYQDINGDVQVRDITTSRFWNNVIYGSNQNEFLIEIDQAASAIYSFDHNVLRTNESTSGPEFDGTSTWVNQSPGFVSSYNADFHLTSSAFARDKGVPSNSEATLDLDGVWRNDDGMGFDLGAYEYAD